MTDKPDPHRLQEDPPEGSRKTIERRLSAIFAKLGVRSRTELARVLRDS